MKSSKWVAPSAAEMARIRREAGTDETAIANAKEEEMNRGTFSGETERAEDGAERKLTNGQGESFSERV